MKVILASASPRRKELLGRIFPDFQILSPAVDESVPPEIPLDQAPVYLAQKKADFVRRENDRDFIIAADTVVIFNKRILGKPKDDEDARCTLTSLSGQTHKVITGCCICLGNKVNSFSVESKVSFYPLSEKEIEEYIASGEHRGKAGSYAIQGLGALFVKSIEGDYYNIVGLPIGRLKREIDSLMINHDNI